MARLVGNGGLMGHSLSIGLEDGLLPSAAKTDLQQVVAPGLLVRLFVPHGHIHHGPCDLDSPNATHHTNPHTGGAGG